jgi:hypothetical protein
MSVTIACASVGELLALDVLLDLAAGADEDGAGWLEGTRCLGGILFGGLVRWF